jgi:hypothetical protein
LSTDNLLTGNQTPPEANQIVDAEKKPRCSSALREPRFDISHGSFLLLVIVTGMFPALIGMVTTARRHGDDRATSLAEILPDLIGQLLQEANRLTGNFAPGCPGEQYARGAETTLILAHGFHI